MRPSTMSRRAWRTPSRRRAVGLMVVAAQCWRRSPGTSSRAAPRRRAGHARCCERGGPFGSDRERLRGR
eukprot:7736496-Alexandrium_andersonii.AAC.1